MISRVAPNPITVRPILASSRPLYLLGAALMLLALQLLSGTGPVYALLVFTLLLVTYVAVCCAGGLETLFGIAICYLLLQHVLISQVAMIFFWEPADAPLRQPVVTMSVYVVGMMSLALGALLANRLLRRKHSLFVAETNPRRLFWLSILATLFSTLLIIAAHTVGVDTKTGGAVQGGVLGPLKQIQLLGPLAIASGTAYMIKSSRGRHSLSLINGIPMIVQIVAAILGANREASVSPIIIYALTCIAFHYRFRPKHYAALCVGAYVANYILFPYALIARGFVRTGSDEQNVSRSLDMLVQIAQNPFKYRDQVNNSSKKQPKLARQFNYYSHTSPTLSRYTILPITDGLVDATLHQGTLGLATITPGLEASLPRFLNPDKPYVQMGNLLTHRVPGLSPGKNDRTTGITTGFFADAFSSFEWLGISLMPCLIIFSLMMIYGLLINFKIWDNVLMLSLLIQISWTFSEVTTANMILLCTVGALAATVGIALLYLLTYTLDKVIGRHRNVLMAGMNRRRQVLQRIELIHSHESSAHRMK